MARNSLHRRVELPPDTISETEGASSLARVLDSVIVACAGWAVIFDAKESAGFVYGRVAV